MNSCAAMNATRGSASGQAAACAKASISRFCATAGGGLGTLEQPAAKSRANASIADRTTMAFLPPWAFGLYIQPQGSWVDAARRRRLRAPVSRRQIDRKIRIAGASAGANLPRMADSRRLGSLDWTRIE